MQRESEEMKIKENKMKIKENIKLICVVVPFGLLILSPFIIGFLLYLWLNPITCVEKVIVLFVITIICTLEAVMGWSIAANL